MTTDEKTLVNDFQRAYWGDHEFAAWLRSKDPNWTFESFKQPVGTYFIAHGKIIAVVFYNNAKSTHKIWVKKDEP